MGHLSLQKQLSTSNDFYFSAVTTLSNFSKTVRHKRQELRETVVALNFSEKFIQFFEKKPKEVNIVSHKWLLTMSNSTLKPFKNLTIPLDSEFVVAQQNPKGGYNLQEVYDTRPGTKFIKALGQWFEGKKEFHLAASPNLYKRRKNLERTLIKVVSSSEDSCVNTSFAIGVANIVMCIHQRVWSVMAEMLNASTEIMVVSNLTTETIKNTDAELTFRSAPVNVVDLNFRSFVAPIFIVRLLIVASYTGQKVEWRTFMHPLSKQMWLAIWIWLIIGDLILAFVEFITHKKGRNNFLTHCRNFSFTTISTFCSQGVLGSSKFLGVHIIFLMMYVVPGVIFQGYSALITSYLTVQPHKMPFRNLEELSQAKDYKLGWHNTLTAEHFFNFKDMSPLNQALINNNVLPQEKLPATDLEAIERVCEEKFAFITIRDTVLALKPKCRYFSLKQHFKVVVTSMEMKKYSSYKYFLDRCERTLEFSGIMLRLKLHTIMKYVRYNVLELGTNEVSPIALENIVLPFVVLLSGAIFSVFLLIFEIISFRTKSIDPIAINLASGLKNFHVSQIEGVAKHPQFYE